MYAHLMEFIGSFQAKTHLARLLARVERGESFTITRRGRAVARLAPMSAGTVDRRTPGELVEALRRVRERIASHLQVSEAHGSARPSIRDLINEGRKR